MKHIPSTNQYLSLALAWLLSIPVAGAQEKPVEFHHPVVCEQEPRCLAAISSARETGKTSKKEALRLMLQAYTEFPDPRLCFNIGRLFQQTGAPRDAISHFHQFLDFGAEQDPELLAMARSFLAQAEKEIQHTLPQPPSEAPPLIPTPPPTPTSTAKQTPMTDSQTEDKTLAQHSRPVGLTGASPSPSCSKWNFARAATLGASVGVLSSGLLAGAFVASFKGVALDDNRSFENGSFAAFTGQGYSVIGFGAAALALIPAGLALGRSSLFFPKVSADAGNGCVSAPRTRWIAARGAAVGLFSGLLASGLVALLGVSANQNLQCSTSRVVSCDFSSSFATSGALSATWALGLTLALVIPIRVGSS